MKLLPEDPKQAVRLRRFFMAAGTSMLVLFLLLGCYRLGFIKAGVLARASFIIVALNLGFYGVFRAGWNLKAKDPSLTKAQMFVACATIVYVMYHAGPARGVFLIIILMIFMFGIFRLSAREFMGIGLIVLTAYASMLWQLYQKDTPLDWNLELLQLTVFALVVPWFSVMGGYIGRLRRRLNESALELESSQALAVRDELTGSYNRRYLMGALHKEKNRSDRGSESFCVCMMDLDHFKKINDTRGHLAGDAVLKAFAASIEQVVRSTDYFGRFGGEEFLLILSETPIKGACMQAERIREQIERLTFGEALGEVRVTVSIGVTRYRLREEVSKTLARADAALYQAKNGGRNRVVCEGERLASGALASKGV